LNTTAARALFNSALQDASGTAALNLNNIASGAAAVVAAANGGTSLTVANLTNLGLTGVTSTNLEGIRSSIDATNDNGSEVDSMAELRAIVTPITSDTTAPSATLTTGTTNTPGTANATVQSSEEGTAYLVKTGGTGAVTVSNLANITGADGAKWNSVAITAAATNTNLGLSGLEDGTYTLYTVDKAGNLSGASSTSYVVDTTAPTLVVTQTNATIAGDGVINTAERTAGIALSGTTEAGRQVTIATGTGTNVTVTSDPSSGAWTATVPTANLPTSGNVTFTVTSTDVAGNTATETRSANQFVLDALGNSGAASYSLRLLDADKATNAIQVRRSSDGALKDIGFTASGDLDTAALLEHVGTGSGFVRTWYDQSGNGRHAVKTTEGSQPRIVSNGVIETQNGRPAIRFNGSSTYLGGVPLSHSEFTLATVLNDVTQEAIIRYSIGTGSASPGRGIFSSFASWSEYSGDNASLGYLPNSGRVVQTGFVPTIGQSYVVSLTTTATESSIRANGGNNATGGVITMNQLFIGQRGGGSGYYDGYNSETIVFPSALSTTDRQTLEINQGLYYDTSVSAGLFGLWQSDGAGNTSGVTKTTTDALQSWSAQLVSHASQTNAAGTFNGSNPLSQYINRVTGTDVVSAAEFQAGFTITGKAAAGATNIRFYLDNDRTNGTDEIGTQLTHGSNGVSWTYNPTGEYTITFAANSTALTQATHNTHGSGVHKLTVDTNGDGVMQTGEASRLFLVASGTAQTSDTGLVSQNYSVQDRPSGNVFVYFYGDPDGNGIGLWTRLDNGDTAANPGTALTDRDGATLNSIVDWDYYNTGVTAGTQATTANTALGFVTSIAAQVWEFQMGQSSTSDQTWSAARTWAGHHTNRGSNTSRMASLAETLALYAANFGGGGTSSSTGNTVGAVEAMSNLTSTTTAAGENNAPGDWGFNFWTAAPTPSGNALVNLNSGHVLDELGTVPNFRVSAVL
jgi:hypothetical protein